MTTKKRLGVAIVGGALGAIALGAAAGSSEGCHPSPAESADLAEVENVTAIVLTDVLSGTETYEQMFADVATAVAGQAGADVAAILDDAIQFLIDAGKIPASVAEAGPSLLAKAQAVQGRAHAARRAK